MKELLKHSKAIQVGMSRIFWKKLNRILVIKIQTKYNLLLKEKAVLVAMGKK